MKRIFFLLLAVLLLTACGKTRPAWETVETLPDGSYIVTGLEHAPGNDESISLEKSQVVCLYFTDKDGKTTPSFVKLTAEQKEKLEAAQKAISILTYPKLVQKEDGSMEVIRVDQNGDPVDTPLTFNIFDLLGEIEILPAKPAAVTYPALRLREDGSYAVVLMAEDGTPVERTKTATKVTRFYSAEGQLQWTMAVTATFTYNGLEVKASDVSAKITVADPGSWYIIREETDGTAYTVCLGRTTLGVTTSTPEFSIVLHCSPQGALS